jgi:hypothetical protein
MTVTDQTPLALPRGTRVRITIDAAVQLDQPNLGRLDVSYPGPHGEPYDTTIDTDSAAVTVEAVGPQFRHNEAWADRDGLLWAVQADDETGEISLYSSAGPISLAEAEKYAPWTRIHPIADDDPGLNLPNCGAAGCPTCPSQTPETIWTSSDGTVWDLTVDYRDVCGNTWTWLRRFGNGIPIFARLDGELDAPLTTVMAFVGPLIVRKAGRS